MRQVYWAYGGAGEIFAGSGIDIPVKLYKKNVWVNTIYCFGVNAREIAGTIFSAQKEISPQYVAK